MVRGREGGTGRRSRTAASERRAFPPGGSASEPRWTRRYLKPVGWPASDPGLEGLVLGKSGPQSQVRHRSRAAGTRAEIIYSARITGLEVPVERGSKRLRAPGRERRLCTASPPYDAGDDVASGQGPPAETWSKGRIARPASRGPGLVNGGMGCQETRQPRAVAGCSPRVRRFPRRSPRRRRQALEHLPPRPGTPPLKAVCNDS